jgi:hypothetical protein
VEHESLDDERPEEPDTAFPAKPQESVASSGSVPAPAEPRSETDES